MVLGGFLFEVPTGVVGDKISRKLSVLVGFTVHALGTVVLLFDRMLAGLVMAVFYAVYGFSVDKLGLSKARLTFAIALLVIGVSFKVGEVLGLLGDYLKLSHLDGDDG